MARPSPRLADLSLTAVNVGTARQA